MQKDKGRKKLSRIQLFATPWTAAYQAPSPMGFSRQEYWSGVPLPSPSGGQTHLLSTHFVPYLKDIAVNKTGALMGILL